MLVKDVSKADIYTGSRQAQNSSPKNDLNKSGTMLARHMQGAKSAQGAAKTRIHDINTGLNKYASLPQTCLQAKCAQGGRQDQNKSMNTNVSKSGPILARGIPAGQMRFRTY